MPRVEVPLGAEIMIFTDRLFSSTIASSKYIHIITGDGLLDTVSIIDEPLVVGRYLKNADR